MPLVEFVTLTTLGSGIWNGIFIGLGYALGSAPRREDVGFLKFKALTAGADAAGIRIEDQGVTAMPVKGDAPVLPGARAVARHVRISPTKARRVVNLVRGLPAKEALTVLQFAPQAASEQVYKVVASAIANAENNERLDPDALLVAEAFVDEGPTMKRFRPRAQGRAYRIRKRTSHLTVALSTKE